RRRPERYMRFSTSQRLNKREAIMIIQRQEDVTRAVTEAFKNTQPPRLREILMSFVKHLHAFARDVHLTEEEFEKAVQYIVKLAQKTDEKHNEVVLMAGSLGFSTFRAHWGPIRDRPSPAAARFAGIPLRHQRGWVSVWGGRSRSPR